MVATTERNIGTQMVMKIGPHPEQQLIVTAKVTFK
jgi:hypothetical protein